MNIRTCTAATLPTVNAPVLRCSLICALALGATAAHSQSSPFYVGIAQAVSHESNLFRLADGVATPATVKKRSDTVSTTSLVAGIDQPISRQRLRGNVVLRTSQYASNSSLNSEGYSLDLGLDWQTINRISGTLGVGSQSNQRRFDPNETNVGKNIETGNQVSAVARMGVVTPLTLEAGLNWNEVNYSAATYQRAEYSQTGVSLGATYRLGGATTVGATLRSSRTSYNSPGDDRDRTGLDLTVNWVPSGLTTLYGRLGYSRIDAKLPGISDFNGLTGEIRGGWQATGKIRLNGLLMHDTGQNSSFLSLADTRLTSTDYSTTTTRLQLTADYAMSAKVSMVAGVGLTHRALNNSQFNLIFGSVALTGSDDTTVLNLGARWRPTRGIQLGCDLVHEQRRASSSLSLPYSNNAFSCSGQLTIQ